MERDASIRHSWGLIIISPYPYCDASRNYGRLAVNLSYVIDNREHHLAHVLDALLRGDTVHALDIGLPAAAAKRRARKQVE